MSSKNSEVGKDKKCDTKKSHASSLRSKNSIERERRKKLVKFNAVAEIKELSEESNDSKLNSMDVDSDKRAHGSHPSHTVATDAIEAKDENLSSTFNSKRRSHYKNEFTASKTSKHEQSD